MKSILLSLLLCFGGRSYSQEALDSLAKLQGMKAGIYLNYKEFLSNNPSVTSQFSVLPYRSSKANDSSKVRVIEGYYYQMQDSTKLRENVFGFFDGKKFYISNDKNMYNTRRQMFFPLDYVGTYSFVESSAKRAMTIFLPGSVSMLPATLLFTGLSGLDAAASKNKNALFYFNRRGEFLQATPQAIRVLLRKDEDLINEFNSEKRMDIEVYKKYLIKMNERYPLQ